MAHRARAVAVLLALATAAAATVVPAAPGRAGPHLSVGDVARQVELLGEQTDIAVEHYDTARIALATARSSLHRDQAQAVIEQRSVTAMSASLGRLAAAVYRSGGVGMFGALLQGGGPAALLTRFGDLDELARGQRNQLAVFRADEERLASTRRAAGQQERVAATTAAHLAAVQQGIEALLAREQGLLGQLRAGQRAAVLRAGLGAPATPANAPAEAPAAPPPPGSSAIVRAALAAAYAQIGKPYVYGAAGPGAFDCSGLMMFIFGAAGVALPHSAAAQYGYGTHVPVGQLQPGDIVFYAEGGGIGHDGIYVGNGEMIDAPHTGATVGVHPLYPGLIGGTRL